MFYKNIMTVWTGCRLLYLYFSAAYLAGVCSFRSVNVSVGARAGAAEGAEEAGRKRQVAPGVRAARQRFPPVAAGDQVEDVFFQLTHTRQLSAHIVDMSQLHDGVQLHTRSV